MNYMFANRIRVATSTVGTGPLRLGVPLVDMQGFAGNLPDGALVTYTIEDGPLAWEVGSGTYHVGIAGAADTLTRDTVEASTSGVALIVLSGNANVFVTPSANWLNAIQERAGAVLVSDSPPIGVTPGTLWWDSAGAGLYISYSDMNSTQWVLTGNDSNLAGVQVSDTPPVNAVQNTLWYDSTGTGLYLFYNDGNSTQWVTTQNQNALTDAPSDGNTYGRRNGQWSAVTGGVFYIARYGAKSDGVTDDSAAINAAIAAAIAAGGGLVLLSAGRTLLGSAIPVSIPATVTLTIEGMGADVSELYFSNATDGLNFTLSYIASPRAWAGIHLRGFSVTRGPTSPVVANTGISIGKAADALYQGTSSLRDMLVQGSSGFVEANGWNIGILLSSVGGVTVDNVCILGATPIPTSDRGDKLLSIVGGPGPAHPYVASVNIANCYMQGGSCGIGINEYVQGVFINNCTVIAQYDSIRWALMASGSSLDRTHGGEELAVTNCTLNAWHRGVWISFVNQSQVSNTTILRTASGTLAWAGIEVNQSGFNSIIGNNVTGANAADGTGAFGETGILISSCDPGPNTIVGNTCGNIYGYGIWFKGSSTFNVAAGNNFTTAGGTGGGVHGGILEDSPGANTIAGNQWNGLDIPLSRTTVAGHVFVQSTQAQSHQVIYQNVAANNPNRWFAGLIGTSAISDPDNGSNTGSDYQIVASHDDGTIALVALNINRATNVMTLAKAPIITALPVNAANDAAASAAGVPLNSLYRNGSVLMIRTV